MSITAYSGGQKTNYSEYNRDGQVLKEIIYIQEKELSLLQYEYDENNKRIEASLEIKGINTITLLYFFYNENMQINKVKRESNDGSIDNYSVYKYDSSGNPILRIDYNSKDKITSSYKYIYSSDNFQTGEEHYDSKSNLEYLYIFTLNSNGEITKRVKYKANNKKEYEIYYTYKYEYYD
jgi:hypothetical protein